MAEQALFPSLSEDGWVTSPEKTADYLLSHFIVADASQSYVFSGNVSSLPKILQETQGDIMQTCIAVRQSLNDYFSRYFNNVVTEVSEIPNTQNPAKQQIGIYVKYTDTSGVEHVLGKELRMANSIVESVIAINNG
jgi:hypothetical protein